MSGPWTIVLPVPVGRLHLRCPDCFHEEPVTTDQPDEILVGLIKHIEEDHPAIDPMTALTSVREVVR